MGLTVACVLRSGGVYDVEYVAKLRDGVKEHLREEHEFVCLSDVEVPCERIPLEHDWPGWWAKLELFRLPPPVLYFDLDTIIVGNIRDIAEQAHGWQFTMLRDFYREKGLGSGMMAWGIPTDELYNKFAKDPDGWLLKIGMKGDQGFIEQNVWTQGVVRWQDALPGQVMSYKSHVRDRGVPYGTRVVCFHGDPKPRDIGWKL